MNYHVGPDILSTTNVNKFEKSSECIFSLSQKAVLLLVNFLIKDIPQGGAYKQARKL